MPSEGLIGEDGLEFGVLADYAPSGRRVFVAEGVKMGNENGFGPFAADPPSGRNLRPFNETVDYFYEGLDRKGVEV